MKKAFLSKKISSGKKYYKYFIGYLYNDHKVKSLNIMLPKTNAYVKSFDGQSKWVYSLIEYGYLLEKYNTVWDKVSPGIIKELDLSLSIVKNSENQNKILW